MTRPTVIGGIWRCGICGASLGMFIQRGLGDPQPEPACPTCDPTKPPASEQCQSTVFDRASGHPTQCRLVNGHLLEKHTDGVLDWDGAPPEQPARGDGVRRVVNEESFEGECVVVDDAVILFNAGPQRDADIEFILRHRWVGKRVRVTLVEVLEDDHV